MVNVHLKFYFFTTNSTDYCACMTIVIDNNSLQNKRKLDSQKFSADQLDSQVLPG